MRADSGRRTAGRTPRRRTHPVPRPGVAGCGAPPPARPPRLATAGVDAASFTAGVSAETRMRTTLATVASGDQVNLEPALAVGDALGGHWVTGHVDGTARVTGISDQAGLLCLALVAPPPLARYLAPKGSIALDGVSLTIN